jgi:O-acetylserine/cysteine efflux transporter
MSLSHIALAVLVAVIWGFYPLSCKLVAIAHFPPIMMIALMFLGASFPLVLFIKRPQIPFWRIGLISLALGCHMIFFVFAIQENVGAGLVSILEESQVFFTMLLAHFMLGYRLILRDIFLVLIGFMGIVLIGANMGLNGGFFVFSFLMTGAIAWALNNIHLSVLKTDASPISTVVWANLLPGIPFLIFAYFYEKEAFINAIETLTWHIGVLIFFISFVAGSMALWILSYLLRHNNPMHVSAFALLSPLVGVLSSAYFCDEALTTETLWGGALILLSLVFLQVSTHHATYASKR